MKSAFAQSISASLVAMVVLVFAPTEAAAQADSSIAGVVEDATGGVMPGVTVEASSPALIEKARTVVTDNQGQYKILGLRPGVYTVTFTLSGFSTVRREGIELTASFTATVDARLRVGSLEETITVSGAAPEVDVRNVVQQKVISSETISAIPMGRVLKAMTVALNPAVVNTTLTDFDMGGSSGDAAGAAAIVHGSRGNDGTFHYDGLRFSGIGAAGHGFAALKINVGNVNEIAVETAGMSAEQETAGVRLNIIPREGGNAFSGMFFSSYTNHNLQSDNLTDELQAAGLKVSDTIQKIWDANLSFGGRIKRDKLWFYTSVRSWGAYRGLGGAFYDKIPYDFVYTPDESRQAIGKTRAANQSLRLTWQATSKDKLNLHYETSQYVTPINLGALRTWEAHNWYDMTPSYMATASWTRPVTNRLLLEAAGTFVNASYNTKTPNLDGLPGGRDIAGVVEQTTNVRFRAFSGGTLYIASGGKQTNQRFSAAYVTGSHAFKVGAAYQAGWQSRYIDKPGDMEFTLRNGVPISLTQWIAPQPAWNNMKADLGLFAQDQWTLRNLTLNLGARFDYLNTYVPEQHIPATRFLPARDLAKVPNVPDFKDISPRLGVSYNLFGDGKTALKASVGRYVAALTMQLAEANNPAREAIVLSTTRQWNDTNGNFVPDGDFLNPDANGELGAMDNRGFGGTRVATHYAPETLVGWGRRFSNWEGMVGIQRELMRGLSANISYHRRSYGNFTVTDNVEVTASDYDPYCITAPPDPRLPGGGGQRICGLFDIKPSKLGKVDNYVKQAGEFGKQTEIFTGLDVTLSGRFSNGSLLGGGVAFGRSATDDCAVVVDSPQKRFCRVTPPFFRPQIKLNGAYRLPWDLQASATFQSLLGPQITAGYAATNAEIAPTLGRDLAAGSRSTVLVELIEPGTEFDDNINELDLRLSRFLKFRGRRLQASLDAYNVFNASSIQALNTRFGSAWLQPTTILLGRFFKFGLQVDF